MKILLIMDPGIPVPPGQYGGHERLVYMFAEEYARLGHEVTLLAGPGSYCAGKTVTFGVNNLNRSKGQRRKEAFFVWQYLIKSAHRFTLIHNFGRLIYLLPVLNKPVKKLMTYGRPINPLGIKLINRLPNKNLVFTACSNYCVSTGNVAGLWKTIYNAIDFSKYQLQNAVKADAPLMFLGRLDKIKGAHIAIDVAKKTNHQLILAGNIPHTPDGEQYFKTMIEPLIDGEQIIYVGALYDEQKNNYLQQAKGLLFPIEWDEPFGMVMVEAMACGTPVIGFRRGSVPEVITEGVTGYIVNNEEEMIAKLPALTTINRKQCREYAMKRFDVKVIAQQYLNIFND